MPADIQTIDLAPLSLRAAVQSFNPEARTADLVFSTGAGVERYDWLSGKRYLEKLEISKAAIDATRLNAGAPLLDSHSSWSVSDQLGAVVPESFRIDKGQALVTVKFSARDTVAPILRDVADGIISSVSVGYRVSTYEETTAKENELPVRTAKRWMPYEVSLVSMPADVGARVRGEARIETNICRVSRRNDNVHDADRTRRFRAAVAHAS